MPTPEPPQTGGHFAADDSAQMLKLLEMEILNRRAKRQAGGDDQRQLVRMFGVTMIFGLLLLVLGAMWYVQTSHMESRLARGRAVTASPAPAASAPTAGPARPPKPTDH